MRTSTSFFHDKLFLLFLFLPFYSNPVIGMDLPGHLITVKINNCKDTLFYLNHYSGKDIINDDTAKRNKGGTIIFSGPDTLDIGMYFISSNVKSRYFDFFITDNQELNFECDLSEVVKTLTTSDSSENRIYFKTLSILQSNVLSKGYPKSDSLQYLLAHADFSDPALQKEFGRPGNNLSLSGKYIKASISPADYQRT